MDILSLDYYDENHTPKNRFFMAKDKWIQSAIKRPGRLHDLTNTPKGQKIPMSKIKKAEHSKNKSVAAAARLGERLKKGF